MAFSEGGCMGHQGFAPQLQVHRADVRGCRRGARAAVEVVLVVLDGCAGALTGTVLC